VGVSIRATWLDVLNATSDLEYAIAGGAPQKDIDELKQIVDAITEAFNQNRGMTKPLPLCGTTRDIPTYMDASGRTFAYNKPIMVLTDEFTASAAELFAAIVQDTHRATTYGLRSIGAGGAVDDFYAGIYSESFGTWASALIVRNAPVTTMEYPAAPYIENIGVRPDTTADYMTIDNLNNHGKTFVGGFTAAMVKYIQQKGSSAVLP